MMKLSRGFIVSILILFALLVLVEVKIPKRFTWEDWTFSHTDPNPFGSMLVDSLLKASLKSGYEVKSGYLVDAYNDSDNINSTILLVNYSIEDYEEEEIEKFLKILKRGQNIIFINDYLCDSLCNKLDVGLDNGYDYYSPDNFLTNADSTILTWRADSIYDKKRYRFRIFSPENYAVIAGFEMENAKWTPFIKQKLRYGGDIIVAASRQYGKGKLLIVSWPQVFTNYNILEKDGAHLLMRIMSQVGDKHMVRYDLTQSEDYITEQDKSKSPLRVFLDNKSLRWAVYLTLFTILLSLIFTARRRQRVIPVIEPPKNQTLSMVKHIGLMHYRHHDNTSLVLDYYKQFSHEMMKKLLVDINNEIDLGENLSYISKRTGIDADQLSSAIERLKEIHTDFDINDTQLSDKETKYLIDIMNNVINNL